MGGSSLGGGGDAAYLADPASTAFGAVIDPDSLEFGHLDLVRTTRTHSLAAEGSAA